MERVSYSFIISAMVRSFSCSSRYDFATFMMLQKIFVINSVVIAINDYFYCFRFVFKSSEWRKNEV